MPITVDKPTTDDVPPRPLHWCDFCKKSTHLEMVEDLVSCSVCGEVYPDHPSNQPDARLDRQHARLQDHADLLRKEH